MTTVSVEPDKSFRNALRPVQRREKAGLHFAPRLAPHCERPSVERPRATLAAQKKARTRPRCSD